MRLTKAMRDTAIEHIVSKVFPSTKEAEIKEKLIAVLDNNEEWKLRKKLAKDYPNIVTVAKVFYFIYNDWGHKICVSLDEPVASRQSYCWWLSINEKRSEDFYCEEFKDIGKEFDSYMNDRDEYKSKVTRVILSCNTTKQLYEAIPEMDGFFGVENKSQKAKALVPQALIDEVRAMIPQVEEADNE